MCNRASKAPYRRVAAGYSRKNDAISTSVSIAHLLVAQADALQAQCHGKRAAGSNSDQLPRRRGWVRSLQLIRLVEEHAADNQERKG
jgi:hypothetical protein